MSIRPRSTPSRRRSSASRTTRSTPSTSSSRGQPWEPTWTWRPSSQRWSRKARTISSRKRSRRTPNLARLPPVKAAGMVASATSSAGLIRRPIRPARGGARPATRSSSWRVSRFRRQPQESASAISPRVLAGLSKTTRSGVKGLRAPVSVVAPAPRRRAIASSPAEATSSPRPRRTTSARTLGRGRALTAMVWRASGNACRRESIRRSRRSRSKNRAHGSSSDRRPAPIARPRMSARARTLAIVSRRVARGARADRLHPLPSYR